MDHTARAELLAEFRIIRIVLVLGLFLGIEVIEIAEELVKAMHGGQELVAVALVVLAELTGGIALRLQDRCHGHVGFLPALGAPGTPTLVMPVRSGLLPPMNAARPAVQLCWP